MQGTIGSIGCAMTCTAMILKYYGVDTDPKQLNSWLNANKGYAVSGRLYW
jgi:ABC-type bacteriocin/lantibiotic exporter with double-glycine peptidase domain